MSTIAPKKKKASAYRMRNKFYDFACIVPALVFFAIFVYYPIVELFRYSMTDWNLMRDSYNYVGFKNYQWLFTSSVGWKRFSSSLTITLLYTLGDVAASCIFGILLALLFNRMSSSFKVMRTLVILPKYVTVSATTLVFLLMYNKEYGLINNVLKALHLPAVSWLNSKDTALISVIIYSFWRSVGYAMMIYLSAIKGLSQDYFEAASLDGANGMQKFRYITLPLIAPTTLFLAVTSFLAAMKVYQTVEMLTGGGPYESTSVIVYWIYALAFRNYRVDRASAVGCVFFVILLICTVLTMNVSDRKVNYDA